MRYSRLYQDMEAKKMNADPKMENTKAKNITAIVITLVIVVALAIYLIGAASVGNFISEKIITPVFGFISGKEQKENNIEAAQKDSVDRETEVIQKEIRLEPQRIYSLQTGVFSSETNALAMAQQLQSKGGAGYIYEEDGKFRVLLVAYDNQSDAQNVKQRLEENQQLETKFSELFRPLINIQLQGNLEQITVIEQAFGMIEQTAIDILGLSLEFDKGALDETAVKARCAELFADIYTIKKSVDENDNIVYYEDSFNYWRRWEYDEYGNVVYYGTSHGDGLRTTYEY